VTAHAATIPDKVAVVGSGEIGCGWAALCASAGWSVAVFDTSMVAVEKAFETVPRRSRSLVALDRAPEGVVERGIKELHHGRSLLQAVQGADWVIEAISEDLLAKQRLWDLIEQVAEPDAICTSSSSGLSPTDVFARCRRQERCLVAHPLNPPELIPLVELVPGERTADAAMARAESYLRALGRFPIRLHKAVPGFVVGRIAAAVWRECIDLVLQGVIDVDELDRALSLGPALGWAAAGPHLTYHLAAGEGGFKIFAHHLLASFESWWADLANWSRLEPEQQRALAQRIEQAYGKRIDALRDARDRRLSAILKALEQARTDTP
jgi:3-hydroxyacyl-CoA dehydrogenase